MHPLINLRRFVAVLILLIIPAALLTAYFRNFQPESDGQESGAADGHHPSAGQSAMGGGRDGQAEMRNQGEQGSGEMDHSKMTGNADGPAAQPAFDSEQLEASRAQLEASRLQLEASRMALEAAKLQAPQLEKSAPADGTKPSPARESAADGHAHKH